MTLSSAADLTERILLPLLGHTITQGVRVFDEGLTQAGP